MPQVRTAVPAQDFRPHHAQARVRLFFYVAFCNHIIKTRPAGLRIEFRITGKEWHSAGNTDIRASLVIVGVFAGIRRLRSFQKTNIVLLGREFVFYFCHVHTLKTGK